MKKSQARLRLVALDGGLVSRGYKSGRKRWREIPVAASTASTRSAGSPRASQLDTVPCDPSCNSLASADCPPTALHASRSASLLMRMINAQTVNPVNAYSVKCARNMRSMGRPTESEPSAFWRRLVQCWGARNLPTSQTGVAQKLDMSQGSVRRWFAGEGFPETLTLVEIARLGRVSIDWLLTGKHHASGVDKDLDDLLEIWGRLEGPSREHVVRTARGEDALAQPPRDTIRRA